ncbi:MAG: TonB-dependent siderophore receptor [Rhizobiales bacterium]|nr:TonB-dependent siderophore receptor [Hyphomicrobiales bacterium]
MTTGNVRAFARFAACAVSLSTTGALAQQAAEPAQELPPLEVTAKKAAKKAPAKKAQAKAAPKASPQPVAAPQAEHRPAGVTNGLPAVQDYVATDATTGTKTDTPLKETPQSISVVGKEQIRDQGVQNLQEAFRYTPGVIADPFGYDSRYDSSMIRGTNAAFFIDGLRTTYGFGYTSSMIEPYSLERAEVLRGPASMLYGQAPVGGIINAVSKLPSELPYTEIGVDYGSFDFKQVRFDSTGKLTEDGKWLYRIVGLGREAETQVDFVDNDRLMLAPSITYRPTNDTSITFLGNLRKDQSGSTQQFLPQEGTLYPNEANNKRVRRSTFVGEPTDHYDTDAQSASIIVDHKFSDALSIHHASRYAHTETNYDSTYGAVITPARFGFINALLASIPLPFTLDPSTSPFLNGSHTEIARARTASLYDTDVFNTDTSLTGQFTTGPIAHKLTGGVDYMRYDHERRTSGTLIDNLLTTSSIGFPLQPVFDIFNPTYGQSGSLISTTGGFVSADDIPILSLPGDVQTQTGLYIQDQLNMGPWRAVLGLRQDWVSIDQGPGLTSAGLHEDDTATTGRAALMYDFSFGLTPYVSYSTSFSPQPGTPVGDHIFTDFRDTHPAGPLEGEQLEIGFKYQPRGAPFAINAALYELTDKNQTVQPDFLFQAVQGADVNVRGFEIEAIGKVTPELKILASYTYTDATYDKYPELFPYPTGISDFMEGKRIDGVPEHMASLWAIYSVNDGLFKGLSFGGGVRYVGSTESHGLEINLVDLGGGNLFPVLGPELAVKTPSYTLFDAMIAYETEDWRWQLTAQNLEDKYFVTSCTVYRGDCGIGQARTILTGFTYKF